MAIPRRVLIVEDYPDVLSLLIKTVERANIQCEIITATTGAEALQKINSFVPDLLLLDYNLPDMTALDLCRALPAVDRSITTLVFSGQMNESLSSSLKSAGAAGTLAKPFTMSTFVQKVRELYGCI